MNRGILLVLIGCSSGTAAPAVIDRDTGTPVADVAETPCGFEEGQALCDGDFQGYARNASAGLATEAPFGPTTLAQVLAAGTQKYAFIFNTAYW
jgi:hypothetical protein